MIFDGFVLVTAGIVANFIKTASAVRAGYGMV